MSQLSQLQLNGYENYDSYKHANHVEKDNTVLSLHNLIRLSVNATYMYNKIMNHILCLKMLGLYAKKCFTERI